MLSEYIKETSCRHTEVPQTNRVLAVVRFTFISPVNLVSALFKDSMYIDNVQKPRIRFIIGGISVTAGDQRDGLVKGTL